MLFIRQNPIAAGGSHVVPGDRTARKAAGSPSPRSRASTPRARRRRQGGAAVHEPVDSQRCRGSRRTTAPAAERLEVVEGCTRRCDPFEVLGAASRIAGTLHRVGRRHGAWSPSWTASAGAGPLGVPTTRIVIGDSGGRRRPGASRSRLPSVRARPLACSAGASDPRLPEGSRSNES